MDDTDFLVIGGGFYGCCLALYLRSVTERVTLVEAGDRLLGRASRVNQARIHTGFHYPRSALTAVKSLVLHRRFMEDFPEATVSDFQMLYAIARRGSKVSAKRFHRMFRDIGAPIATASVSQAALFDPERVEAVFACHEAAFDHSVLARLLEERLHRAKVDLRLGTEVIGLQETGNGVVAELSTGDTINAGQAFNVTYAQVNEVLNRAHLPRAQLKHELTEIALVSPPPEMERVGVTVMDGPFFSCMPYPSEGLYSLTHVRYTPRDSWTDESGLGDAYSYFGRQKPQTHVAHMIRDAQRYMPCLADAVYRRSLFDVKTVLLKNETDDGRPILYQRKPENSRVVSVLGGKIDNIYDLFDIVRTTIPGLARANDTMVLGRAI
ncbi:FAD-dependent oxidoreductase [Tistrella mobilis]|uniref:NAD(P)/FAD-dependent oxidoreductase n=1 Tax=Tistrella mobilis TaxID=171437 RepID=UPI003555FB83